MKDAGLRFRMFLARTVLHSTLAELNRRMTHPELLLWIAAYNGEPWGELRADIAAGRICAVTATAHSTKRVFRASDFVHDYAEQYREPQTMDEQIAAARKFTLLFGGQVVK